MLLAAKQRAGDAFQSGVNRRAGYIRDALADATSDA